jgi:hypothetical protein
VRGGALYDDHGGGEARNEDGCGYRRDQSAPARPQGAREQPENEDLERAAG